MASSDGKLDMSSFDPAMLQQFAVFMKMQQEGKLAKPPTSDNIVVQEHSSVIPAPKASKKKATGPPRKSREEKAVEKKRAMESEHAQQLEWARQLTQTRQNPFLKAVTEYSLRSYDDPVVYFDKLTKIARAQLKVNEQDAMLLGAILRISFETTHKNHIKETLGTTLETIIGNRFDKAEIRKNGTADIGDFVTQFLQPLYFVPPEWLIAGKGGVIPPRFLATSKRRSGSVGSKQDAASAAASGDGSGTQSLNLKEMLDYLLKLAKDGEKGSLRAEWYKATMLDASMGKAFWKVIDEKRAEIFDQGVCYVSQHSDEYKKATKNFLKQEKAAGKLKASFDKAVKKFQVLKAAGKTETQEGKELMAELQKKKTTYQERKGRMDKYKKRRDNLKEQPYPSLISTYPFYAAEWCSRPLDGAADGKKGKKKKGDDDEEEDDEAEEDDDDAESNFHVITNRATERFISNCTLVLEMHVDSETGKRPPKRPGGDDSPPFALDDESLAIAKCYEGVWKAGQRHFLRASQFLPDATKREAVDAFFLHVKSQDFVLPRWPFRWLLKNIPAAEAMLEAEAAETARKITTAPGGGTGPSEQNVDDDDEAEKNGDDEADDAKEEDGDEDKMELDEGPKDADVDLMNIDAPTVPVATPPRPKPPKSAAPLPNPTDDTAGKKRSKKDAEISSESDEKPKKKKAKTEEDEKKKTATAAKPKAPPSPKPKAKAAAAAQSKKVEEIDAMDLDTPTPVIDMTKDDAPPAAAKPTPKKKAAPPAAATARPVTMLDHLRLLSVSDTSQLFAPGDADALRTLTEEEERLISLETVHHFSQPYPTATLIPTADALLDLIRNLSAASTAKKGTSAASGTPIGTVNTATLLRSLILATSMEHVATNHAAAVRDRVATTEDKHEAALMDYFNDDANVAEMSAKILPVLGASKVYQLTFGSQPSLALPSVPAPIAVM